MHEVCSYVHQQNSMPSKLCCGQSHAHPRTRDSPLSARLTIHLSAFYDLQWTPEGRRVLTGSTSGEFTLWNGLTFNFETILQAHDSAVRTMQFTHSGAYLASADQSGVIKYFQPNMNNLTAWTGHREAIRGLSFSPDDGRFATASDDSTVRIWSFEESREERVLTGQFNPFLLLTSLIKCMRVHYNRTWMGC